MTAENQIAAFGPYRLNASARLLQRDGDTIPVGGRAMDILIALIERVGEVVSRRELMQRAWPDLIVEEANLRVHIGSLRKALGEGESGARYVANVAGRGYCFVMPVKQLRGESGTTPVDSLGIAPLSHPCNLPTPLARMVGRDDAINTLSRLISSRRFVSLVGVGGVGKTTVAVRVAHEMLEDFAGAVYFADLSTISEPSQFMEAVLKALSIASPLQDPITNIHAALSDRRALLILDNCEHLIDAIALPVERLHAGLPALHILVTSRESLRVEGEHVFLLPPLETPPLDAELTASRALESPAVQLFMDRAEAGGFRRGLLDQDAPVVAVLCDRLDGIPLALELAGSCAGTYGIQGTAELLDNRFKLVWRGRRSAPPRHQTLHAMVDWSYNLLTVQERQIFARLSVFMGNFTLEAAQAVVCDEAISPSVAADAIASLADKSLLSIVTSSRAVVFRLLETTRLHAGSKLADSGEQAEVAKRCMLHCSRRSPSSASASLLSLLERDDLSGRPRQRYNGLSSYEWSAPNPAAVTLRSSRRSDAYRTAQARLACGPV